ncbi:hypothetical protein SUGI_0954530 [Cryptomeria japonica]|nr:hypothetical protein SUGI_0954530 [Cryptomeria japonica]
MVHFLGLNCANCEVPLEFQVRDLFETMEFGYNAIRGMVECSLSLDRHWCDGAIYEAVLAPMVDILESRDKCAELLEGFVKKENGNMVVEAIYDLVEGNKNSVLKVYFSPENYFLDIEEESVEEEESEEEEGSDKDDGRDK